MEVDYLLYHQDRNKIDRMLEGLTKGENKRPNGLFNTEWLEETAQLPETGMRGWRDVRLLNINIKKLGRNVLRYNVTLPGMFTYPKFY